MERIVLSSRITLMYKLVLPIFFGLATLLVWVGAIALYDKPDGNAMIVVGLFFTGFMALMTPPMFINKVSYDDEYLHTYNYLKKKKIPLSNVIKVHRWMFYFYKISYTNETGEKKGILLLPSFVQRLEAMMGMPANLEEFEDKISTTSSL